MNTPRQSIVSAVQRLYDSTYHLHDYLPGGMWTGEVPENQTMPYGMLESEDSDFEWTFEDKYLEHCRFSVVFYASGADSLDEIMNEFEGAMNWEDLNFDEGDEAVCIYPLKRSIRSEFARDADGNQVFSGILRYEASVWRN